VIVSADAEDGDSITLKPVDRPSPLRKKGEILVHTGRLTDTDYDFTEHLQRSGPSDVCRQKPRRSSSFSDLSAD
jgi:hypothetical protein